MSHLSTTVRVEASPEVVYDIVADPARGPEWQTLVAELGEIVGPAGRRRVELHRLLPGRRPAPRGPVRRDRRGAPDVPPGAGTTRGGWARWTTMIEPLDGGAASEVRVIARVRAAGRDRRVAVRDAHGQPARAGVQADVHEPQAPGRGGAGPPSIDGPVGDSAALTTGAAADRDSRPDAGRPRRRRGERQVDVRGPLVRPVGGPLVRRVPGDPDRRRGRSAGDEDGVLDHPPRGRRSGSRRGGRSSSTPRMSRCRPAAR